MERLFLLFVSMNLEKWNNYRRVSELESAWMYHINRTFAGSNADSVFIPSIKLIIEVTFNPKNSTSVQRFRFAWIKIAHVRHTYLWHRLFDWTVHKCMAYSHKEHRQRQATVCTTTSTTIDRWMCSVESKTYIYLISLNIVVAHAASHIVHGTKAIPKCHVCRRCCRQFTWLNLHRRSIARTHTFIIFVIFSPH